MSGELIPPQNLDQEIFDSHFRDTLTPSDFERAHSIFTSVGRFNEKSIAMQFDLAAKTGKVEEVLSAYEKIMDPEEGFLHLVPDPITTAAEIRRFGDVIYGSVITEGDPMKLLEIGEQFESPKIFELMGQS